MPTPIQACHCLAAMVMAEAEKLILPTEASTPISPATPSLLNPSLRRYPPPSLALSCQAVAYLP